MAISVDRTLQTAVVTGPTGAVGVALCEQLLAQGCTVYAVCRPGSPRAGALPAGVRTVFCDLAGLAALPGLVSGRADAFFHLAWAHTIGPGRNDMPAQIANIRYTVDAVRAAAALGCKVFVGAGSQAEYGRAAVPLAPDTPAFPETGYGMAKLCAGQMARAEAKRLGLACVWPRILSVYGPHDGVKTMVVSVLRGLLAGQCPPLTKGEQMWDYLYAADAGRALYLLARHGRDGGVYPLGSGAARPLREYILELRDAVDPALPLGFGQVPYGENQVLFLQADTAALHADTGFVPQTDFKTGIRATAAWVREEYHAGR